MCREARECKLFGLVQGVGFRPFVHRLAQQYSIVGWVLNSSAGLTVFAEGEAKDLKEFIDKLVTSPPPAANISRYEINIKKPQGFGDFSIRQSQINNGCSTILPPDTGVCNTCLAEFYDQANMRHNYLLISCADCGPRFSLAYATPYDREATSMKMFTMCPKCQQEYHDIENRRYHVEGICCEACGPRVWLSNPSGSETIASVNELLKSGKIIAVKGLSGFHLAAATLNQAAVLRLRQRKGRDGKPFAVMCRDLKAVKEYCKVSAIEAELLNSPAKPIVLLERLETYLPPEISPGMTTLGVMLPYTPLHSLLFDEKLSMLVLTSANLSDEPLIAKTSEALKKLQGIADYFLLHDRPIVNSCDDSVAAVFNSEAIIYRRARGYVPLPINLHKECKGVFAAGGELKSTFCIVKGQEAFISQHFGDLAHYGNYQRYLAAVERFKQITGSNPKIIAHDLHPDYISTKYAVSLKGVTAIPVQHHHAHLASCMAENHLEGSVLGVICDGAGYGTDGCIWGCEFLYGDYGKVERLAHLEYMPYLGDETAYHPAYTAFSYLYSMFGSYAIAAGKTLLNDNELTAIKAQLDCGFRSLWTSSCGRLFDAVSALIGVCHKASFDGEAAMRLEAISTLVNKKYSFTLEGKGYPYRLTIRDMFAEMLFDLKKRTSPAEMGGKFHAAVIDMIVATTLRLSSEKKCQQVALSGGTFQNRLLLKNVVRELKNNGLNVYIQHQVPTNDGGLSLGQALVGEEVYKRVSGGSGESSRDRN